MPCILNSGFALACRLLRRGSWHFPKDAISTTAEPEARGRYPQHEHRSMQMPSEQERKLTKQGYDSFFSPSVFPEQNRR